MVLSACTTDAETSPPPTGTEVPPPDLATDPASAGAQSIGAAVYAVPDDALVVDPAVGNDGSSGSADAPLRTAQAAADRAVPGQTIVLREGEYHETVYVNTPVTIQNQPGEAAWLDGSEPVTGWESEGDLWSAPLPVVLDRSIGPDAGDPYVSEEFPAAAEPEMLFRDGTQLQQVMDRSQVDENSFYADRRRQRLYVGDGPEGPGASGHEWRTASLAQAIVVSSPDVTIRGIGVRRYGNSVTTQGAIYLARQGNLLDNVVVEDVATTGVSFYSEDNQGSGSAVRTTIRRAGLMGVGATVADGLRVREVLVEEANFERFNPTPNSAGIKVTRSRDVVVESSVFLNSRGTTAIWLDEAVVGFGVYRNRVEDNGATGISVELSSQGRIVDNLVAGHQFGVVLYSSGSIDVTNNRVMRNTEIDLDLRQDHRRQADPASAGRDPRYGPGDPTNPWLVTDVSISCNVLGPGPAGARLRAVDTHTGIAADDMDITVDSTTFVVGGDGTVAARWGTGPPDETRAVTDPEDLPRTPDQQPNLTASAADAQGAPECDP